MPDSQQGIAKSGAVVLNPTFVHFMNICARLNICAFITPPSAIPKPLAVIVQNRRTKENLTKNELID
jgi:hypothetical protein